MKTKKIDTRELLRNAIFAVVEYCTGHALYEKGRILVLHYFNTSGQETSFTSALYAVEKYFPESLPPDGERSPKLEALIVKMRDAADLWDREQDA